MNRRVALLLANLVVALSVNPASAYVGSIHEELGRQAILYALRSSQPGVRLAGVVVMSAGEGAAGPTGQRQWMLAQEAENVDLYRDVLVHDVVEAGFLPDLAPSPGRSGPSTTKRSSAARRTTTGSTTSSMSGRSKTG